MSVDAFPGIPARRAGPGRSASHRQRGSWPPGAGTCSWRHLQAALPGCLLLLAACQAPGRTAATTAGSPLPGGTYFGTTAVPEDARTARARVGTTLMVNKIVRDFSVAYDRQGMTGVIAAIDQCYVTAISPLRMPQDVRDCLVLDMMAFRIDHTVSGSGPPGGPQQMAYFQKAAAARRWDRYAPLGNLARGEEAASFMTNGSELVLQEYNRRRAAPRVS
ncbi:MAG: hypothetical protein E7K72_00040 [Roseomonas mucosa]|nr:hypothetical protein [Roseomonas mucosa]